MTDMSVALIVGTPKGAAILTSKDRKTWDMSFDLRGWPVTASTRDDKGRAYVAVNSPNYGVALHTSDDFKTWKQLESAPRYKPEDRGNPEHHRLVAKEDFGGLLKGGGRFVDQIWNLHFAHGTLYAGVSEAGLFRTDDGGKTWRAKNLGVDPSTKEDVANTGPTTGQCVHSVTHDPKNANVMFRQEHRGVHRSDDGGDTWRVIENGLPVGELSDGHRCSFGFASAMDHKSGQVYLIPLQSDNFRFPCDGQLAVYRTKDGAKWEKLTKGLPGNCFTAVLRGALSADQTDEGGLYFGTASGAVYASQDRGESWREIASGLPRIMSVDAYAV